MRSTLWRPVRLENVRTSELCSAIRATRGPAPSESGFPALRRSSSGGSRRCARRGRAQPRPRGSSGPRRRERRPAARRRQTLPRACARRCFRAPTCARSIQVAAPSCSNPASASAIASRADRFWRARRRTTTEREERTSSPVRIAELVVLRPLLPPAAPSPHRSDRERRRSDPGNEEPARGSSFE